MKEKKKFDGKFDKLLLIRSAESFLEIVKGLKDPTNVRALTKAARQAYKDADPGILNEYVIKGRHERELTFIVPPGVMRDRVKGKPDTAAKDARGEDTRDLSGRVTCHYGEVVSQSYCAEEEEMFEDIRRYLAEHRNDKTFAMKVYEFMDRKHLTSTDVYTAAGMSRQDFSRITKRDAGVSKSFVWSMAIGLRLNISETDELLQSAGYARCAKEADLLIAYCIINKIYDIGVINGILDAWEEPLLTDKTRPSTPDRNF